MTLPVLRPALEAVTFGYERIGMMIRISWFPILLVIGLYIFVLASIAGAAGVFAELSSGNITIAEGSIVGLENLKLGSGEAIVAFLSPFLLSLGAIVLFSPVLVAATRAATRSDYEPRGGFIYFALGSRELKLVVAIVVYWLITQLLFVFFGGIAGVLAAGSVALSIEGGSLLRLVSSVGLAGALAIAIAGVWIGMRLFLIRPIAAVEDRLVFGEAWDMTKGNFWRLVLSYLFFQSLLAGALLTLTSILVVPVAVVFGILAYGVSGFSVEIVGVVVGLGLLTLIPVSIVIAAFGLGATAAFPGRLYAYLSGCGDDCKIL